MSTDRQGRPIPNPGSSGHPWQSAASYAARAHAHQTRRDGATPYAAHTFRVAMTARHLFGCEDEVIIAAALLHDTIEDTGTDYDELAEHFGQAVADCVAALTKNMMLPEPAREAEYDQRLAAAGWRPILIKLADVYDNLSDAHREHVHLAEAADTDEKLSRVLDRARRALTLAKAHMAASPEADNHKAIDAGIHHVESLLATVTRGS